MSRDEWERLATQDERTTPHNRSKGPPSTPALRLVELNRELVRTRAVLKEASDEYAKLERRLQQFTTIGGVSFGGIPAAQVWCDFVLWESLLNETKFRAIIELGTWQGGFSWWLWAQTRARRGMNFYTFDAIAPERLVPDFERRDIFADAAHLGALMRANEPCIVFCDNGNKPRELQTFSKELRSQESLLVVHDWGTEMQPEDVPDNVEMVYEDFCKELGSISRVFRLKENKDG